MRVLKRPKQLEAFVKEVFLLENKDKSKVNKLPFYADGFPGIVYVKTASKILQKPKNKTLSNFFLYGQTLQPIEIIIEGAYEMIAFQLFPFASKLLLGINPKELNDDCYNLMDLEYGQPEFHFNKLKNEKDPTLKCQIISNFIFDLLKHSASNPDQLATMAINIILKAQGAISIKDLTAQLYTTERSLERKFASEIGLSPKQFAKIIQFNYSLNKLNDSHYSKLSDIGYESGYSDQSHFIKSFKKFTGKTPKEFL